MTFDESVMECQMEIIETFNKYKLPASVIILICDNAKMFADKQLKKTIKEEVIENVNQQTNNSDNTESTEENNSGICSEERNKESC